MTLGRDEIAAMLPHAGAMVLLDEVTSWNDSEITCRTGSHRRLDNPLRRAGHLSALCGIEYGAQAMAVHGALLSGELGRSGVLAGLRDVRCHAERLDDIADDLLVHAKLMVGDRRSFMYAFSLRFADTPLVEGQAAVFLR